MEHVLRSLIKATAEIQRWEMTYIKFLNSMLSKNKIFQVSCKNILGYCFIFLRFGLQYTDVDLESDVNLNNLYAVIYLHQLKSIIFPKNM